MLNRSDSYMSLLKYEGDSEDETQKGNATDVEQDKPIDLGGNWIES